MNLFNLLLERRARLYFDIEYYLQNNQDVEESGLDPFDHFARYGWREGRNPSKRFVTLYYLDKHEILPRANPLLEFLRTRQRRDDATAPSTPEEYFGIQSKVVRPLFSEEHYINQVGNVTSDYILHYLRYGWKDNKSPSPDFDPIKYINEHKYIKALDISPFYHYASLLRSEAGFKLRPSLSEKGSDAAVLTRPQSNWSRRREADTWPAAASPKSHLKTVVASEFDADFYLACNQDVRDANLDPLEHFLTYGWREGRNPNFLFHCSFYLAQNPNVAVGGINPFFHYLTVGRSRGLRPNPVGHHSYQPLRAPEDEEWHGLRPASDVEGSECVIIMPVYKGSDETLASIKAVLQAHQTSGFALHVVNDQSPDARLVQKLDSLAELGLFSLETNAENLGFVRSVNNALRRFSGKDVVLLNTDAIVANDWLDRILAHSRRDPTIATITPFSNNATIFSYPVLNNNNIIEMEYNAAYIDVLAASCNKGRVCDMPVGVGFCLFVSAACRTAIGLLDEEAFGRGYGEESDFCLRAAKAGFRNVLAEDVFVYHVGAVSFGKPEASKSAPGQKALVLKHPEYPEILRQHLEGDPSEAGRIRLDLMRLAKSVGPDPVIYVYHSLRGGVITYIEHEEEKLRANGTTVVHLRVGVSDRWSIEIRSGSKDAPYCPNLRPLPFKQFHSILEEFIDWVSPRMFHIHSIVGFDWQSTIGLLDLISSSEIPYRYTLHDYSIVCHRNDLVKWDGRYCGLPNIDMCRACVAGDRSYPEAIDPAVRRETFERFLDGAESVFAPSQDIKRRLQDNGAKYKIDVYPHGEISLAAPTLMLPDNQALMNIVTFGAIGRHKGSRIILSLARDAIARDLPIRYHIVGYSDVPLEMEAAEVIETGEYLSTQEAFARAVAAEPSCILIPSIWPETYCYTLSMAFDLKCPPVVFDIGAQAERVRERNFGLILPYHLIDQISDLNDRLIEFSFARVTVSGGA